MLIMSGRIYRNYFIYKNLFLQKVALLCLFCIAAVVHAQVLHDDSNSIFIAEGTTVSVVESPPVQSSSKPIAVKKIKKHKKIHIAEQPAKHEDISAEQHTAAAKIVIYPSENPHCFIFGKTIRAFAVITDNSKSGQAQACLPEKAYTLSSFLCLTYKHNVLYKESYRQFKTFHAYFCRPPPFTA